MTKCGMTGYDDRDRREAAAGRGVAPWHCLKPLGHTGGHEVTQRSVGGTVVWSDDDLPGRDVVDIEALAGGIADALTNEPTYCLDAAAVGVSSDEGFLRFTAEIVGGEMDADQGVTAIMIRATVNLISDGENEITRDSEGETIGITVRRVTA